MTLDTSLQSPAATTKSQKKTNVHPLIFVEREQLYRAYMPYIRHGALFVKTTQNYQLGEEVFLLIQLPEESQKHSIAGKVVWATPMCSQDSKATGIGVQLLGKDGEALSKRIQKCLASQLTSEQTTDTM